MINKCLVTSLAALTLSACCSTQELDPKVTPAPSVTPTSTVTPTADLFSIQVNHGATAQTVAGCSVFAIVADSAKGRLVDGYDFIFTPNSGLSAVTGGETKDLTSQNERALFIADENASGIFEINVSYNDGTQDYYSSININVVENIACTPNSGWAHSNFETLSTPNGLTIGSIAQPYEGSGLARPISTLAFSANEGMVDVNGANTGAFLITVLAPDSVDAPTPGRGAGWYTNAFNQNNFWALNFNTADVGKKYTSSVWVRLEQRPTDEITLTQWIMPWRRAEREGTCFHFSCGDSGGEIAVTATLAATTQWQYVEFPTIVVPDTFTITGAASMAYVFRGPGIVPDDKYFMDNMAISHTE